METAHDIYIEPAAERVGSAGRAVLIPSPQLLLCSLNRVLVLLDLPPVRLRETERRKRERERARARQTERLFSFSVLARRRRKFRRISTHTHGQAYQHR